MIAGPPIEGNLDCRDRSFHSEICFDVEALRQQPELRDSFRLLQRYHMEHLLTPRQFYYPRVVLDFYQSMTMWTRIFHVRPHSIGETRFLFVKN